MAHALPILVAAAVLAAPVRAPAPSEALGVPLQVEGVGAQIYECKAGADGALAWAFREPVATLVEHGVTVGRHYVGPSWELHGVVLKGTSPVTLPGAGADDVPWLRLRVASHTGDGDLARVGTVMRTATHGGRLQGSCPAAGALQAQPYTATYVFEP